MLSPRRHTIFRVRISPVLAVLAGLFLVMHGAFLSLSNAQGDKTASKGEKVRFTTVDGVEIQGMFYQGSKRNNPTILMLHAHELQLHEVPVQMRERSSGRSSITRMSSAFCIG